MTETIPRLRDADAAADSVTESSPALICSPMRIEARAVRRGLGGDGASSPPVSGGVSGVVPPGRQ